MHTERGRGQAQALSDNPRRLNQQQLLELRAQVEDLQKALQEQGVKTEDVSAYLMPPPCLALPLAPSNPLLFHPAVRCPVQSIVSTIGPTCHSYSHSGEGLGPLDPHSPHVTSLLQSILLKKKLEEHL